MKRITLFVLAGATLLAVPGGASAIDNCSYAGPADASLLGATVHLYDGAGRTPDSLAGVCVDGVLVLDGGYLEAGNGTPGTYAVYDGSDSSFGGGAARGYAGISTYESAPPRAPCGGTATGSGTNSGGCLNIRAGQSSGDPVLLSVPLVPLACGNTTGPDWTSSARDGCAIP